MKKGISCTILLILLYSVSSSASNRNYDSSRYFIKFNNSFLNNPAFTGFNNLFSIGPGFGCYTPDVPVSNGLSKPREYLHSAELSYGKLISYSLGINTLLKNEAAFTKKDINLAFSLSLQTKKFGDFRLGISGSSLNYEFDLSKSTFGDQIDPKLGFIYPTRERLISDLSNIQRYSAGIFYSYKNIFYLGYSKLDINEPIFSFYQDNQIKLHSKSIITAGGRVAVNKDVDILISTVVKNSSYYDLTQIIPSVGLGYKSSYYLNGGINLVNSDFISYFIQLNANVFNCTTVAFKYELLKDNYFSNSLSPSYWGINTTFYIDKLIKQK